MDRSSQGAGLQERLGEYCGDTLDGVSLAEVILALAKATASISALIRSDAGSRDLGAAIGRTNADGDGQRDLDFAANALILDGLRETRTAYYASEEEDAILSLSAGGRFAVAVDPLDGSSNIDANISIGTIFSIFPAIEGQATASFFRPGREQVAAGYVIYGPHTALVLTLGRGTHLFVLDPHSGAFRAKAENLRIAPATSEFAINASNYRHWHEPIRNFIDDCVAGADGPRGKDFNMRWVASLVAETHRIVTRGGVFLYPADRRKGYEQGRLRHIYEAAPVAFVMEQAGAQASDGHTPILDKVPGTLHQRTPLIFGSSEKVARIEDYHANPAFARDESPLFRRRGLFSA
jgi:fructose-1,6-bisphosphatase I